MNQQTTLSFEDELKQLRLRDWKSWIEEETNSILPTERDQVFKVFGKCVKNELTERKNQQITSKIKSARFKNIQTIDQFNFDFSKCTQNAQKSYLNLLNTMDSENLPSAVFYGTPGTGKTHLARAIGYSCCQLGLDCTPKTGEIFLKV